MPVGDLQVGAPGFDEDRLKRHIDWGMRHDVWFHGMGDYTDFLSPSNRRHLLNAGLYDTAHELLDEWNEEHLDKIKGYFKGTEGRWVGLHEGHHYHLFQDGTTTDTRLCNHLGVPFLGTAAVTRFVFKDESRHIAECLVWSHHGEGGGTANPFNRLYQVAPGFPQVDVFLQGHNTALGSRRLDNIWFYGSPGNLHMRSKDQLLVLTGGFMRGYQQGSRVAGRPGGSYVEKGMMRPSAIGGPLITITPRRQGNKTVGEYTDCDLFCSI